MKLFGNSGYLTPDPGVVQQAWCDVCGAEMLVKRNVLGPTSFAGAMGGTKHLHDSFRCLHYEEDWHEHVVKMMSEARNTKSRRIRAIIVQEIKEVLSTRKVPPQE